MKDGGPAFPRHGNVTDLGYVYAPEAMGMSLRDYFAAAALSNPVICTGMAEHWQLDVWFGNQGGITRQQIVAKQANAYADAMLAERAKATE